MISAGAPVLICLSISFSEPGLYALPNSGSTATRMRSPIRMMSSPLARVTEPTSNPVVTCACAIPPVIRMMERAAKAPQIHRFVIPSLLSVRGKKFELNGGSKFSTNPSALKTD